MKRARTPAPTDYSEHRHRWTGLIADIHAAVADDDRSKRDRVWERAGAALNCWTMPAAYPRGMVSRMMAQAALTWSRQTDPEARAAVTPVLMQCVGLCDELLASTPASAPITPQPPSVEATPRRLPYADA